MCREHYRLLSIGTPRHRLRLYTPSKKIPENLIDFDRPSGIRGLGCKTTVRKRFFQYVNKIKGGCWLWTGACRDHGEPEFIIGGARRLYVPRRLSYAMYDKEFDPTTNVRNTCGNRLCVNPEHLECLYRKEEMYTHDINKHPFYSKERGLFFTWRQLRERENKIIRSIHEQGKVTIDSLGEAFNLDRTTISHVINHNLDPKK